eukprot:TRINITY_DN93579_c0_g1_i1.p1 TRINITY_DN93579_c0_g1~~TRINITY_DN93579_c0_g1_i1.p1  ORF type:complete len:478 (+),score=72.72 TRINITY_DN93579_c0_g1_i1:178-1434(+)
MVAAQKEVEMQQREMELAAQNEEIKTKEKKIDQQKKALKSKEEEIEEQQEDLKAQHAKIKELRSELDEVKKDRKSWGSIVRMPGEDDVLKGKEPKIYTIYPAEQYKMSDPGQYHFRTAESQFYRMLQNNQGVKVTRVDYLVNPKFYHNFEAKRKAMAKKLAPADQHLADPLLVFHGAKSSNIDSIIKQNFQLSKVGSATDAGWWGGGIYFSEFPSLSIGYCRGGEKFLLCQILVGKTFHCTHQITGAPLKHGFDSHRDPSGQEIVIFDNHQILPYYCVHFSKQDAQQMWKAQKKGSPLDLTYQQVHKCTVQQLKTHLTNFCLSVQGTKDVLLKRLLDYMKSANKKKKESNMLGEDDCGDDPDDQDWHEPDDSDDDVPKKKKKKGGGKVCPWGTDCYRKNPDHFLEFQHPWLNKKKKGF